MTLRDIYTRP